MRPNILVFYRNCCCENNIPSDFMSCMVTSWNILYLMRYMTTVCMFTVLCFLRDHLSSSLMLQSASYAMSSLCVISFIAVSSSWSCSCSCCIAGIVTTPVADIVYRFLDLLLSLRPHIVYLHFMCNFILVRSLKYNSYVRESNDTFFLLLDVCSRLSFSYVASLFLFKFDVDCGVLQ